MLIHKLQLHGKDLAITSFPGSPTSMGMRPEKVHNHVMGKRIASFHDHLHAGIKVYGGQTSSCSQSSSCFVGGSGNETVVFQTGHTLGCAVSILGAMKLKACSVWESDL